MCYSCLVATSWVISLVTCSQIMKSLHVYTIPKIRCFPPQLPTPHFTAIENLFQKQIAPVYIRLIHVRQKVKKHR